MWKLFSIWFFEFRKAFAKERTSIETFIPSCRVLTKWINIKISCRNRNYLYIYLYIFIERAQNVFHNSCWLVLKMVMGATCLDPNYRHQNSIKIERSTLIYVSFKAPRETLKQTHSTNYLWHQIGWKIIYLLF